MRIKNVFRGMAVLLVLVAVVVGGMLFYADSLVKVGVEKAGTRTLGVETRVGRADISFVEGSLGLDDLEIANPEGFQTTNFLTAGRCWGSVDINSLLSETVKVRGIKIEGLVMTVEQKGATSNMKVILDQIEQKSGKSQEPAAKEGRHIAIDWIEIVEPKAMVKLTPLPGKMDVVELKLGTIRLEKLSDQSDKAVMTAVVFRQVILALAEAVVEVGGDVLPVQLRIEMEKSLKELEEVFGVTPEGILKQMGEVLNGNTKGVDKDKGGLLQLPGKLLEPAAPEGTGEKVESEK